jgi:hypothetical protein
VLHRGWLSLPYVAVDRADQRLIWPRGRDRIRVAPSVMRPPGRPVDRSLSSASRSQPTLRARGCAAGPAWPSVCRHESRHRTRCESSAMAASTAASSLPCALSGHSGGSPAARQTRASRARRTRSRRRSTPCAMAIPSLPSRAVTPDKPRILLINLAYFGPGLPTLRRGTAVRRSSTGPCRSPHQLGASSTRTTAGNQIAQCAGTATASSTRTATARSRTGTAGVGFRFVRSSDTGLGGIPPNAWDPTKVSPPLLHTRRASSPDASGGGSRARAGPGRGRRGGVDDAAHDSS